MKKELQRLQQIQQTFAINVKFSLEKLQTSRKKQHGSQKKKLFCKKNEMIIRKKNEIFCKKNEIMIRKKNEMIRENILKRKKFES